MDITNHPLMDEILKCRSTGPPKLLKETEVGYDALLVEQHTKKLDPSQQKAYLHALEHKLAIGELYNIFGPQEGACEIPVSK